MYVHYLYCGQEERHLVQLVYKRKNLAKFWPVNILCHKKCQLAVSFQWIWYDFWLWALLFCVQRKSIDKIKLNHLNIFFGLETISNREKKLFYDNFLYACLVQRVPNTRNRPQANVRLGRKVMGCVIVFKISKVIHHILKCIFGLWMLNIYLQQHCMHRLWTLIRMKWNQF